MTRLFVVVALVAGCTTNYFTEPTLDFAQPGSSDLALADFASRGAYDLGARDASRDDLSAADFAPAPADMELPSPSPAPSGDCDKSSSGPPTTAYTNATFSTSGGFTFALPAGYQVTGRIESSDAALPAGAAQDYQNSSVSFFDEAGREYRADVYAAPGSNDFQYSLALPAGTYSFRSRYVLIYEASNGAAYLGQENRAEGIVVCGDRVFNVRVPSFGTPVQATVGITNFGAFAGAGSGPFDVIVEMYDSTGTVFAASTMGDSDASTIESQTLAIYLPPALVMTPFLLVQSGGPTAGTPGAFSTRFAYSAAEGPTTSFSLAVPALSPLTGTLSDPTGAVDSARGGTFECQAPVAGIDPADLDPLAIDAFENTPNDSRGVLSSSHFTGYFATGASCVPFYSLWIGFGPASSLSENEDGLLDLPSPWPSAALTIGASPSPFNATAPALSTVTVSGRLTDANGASLRNYHVNARSSSLSPDALKNDRFRVEGAAIWTDSNGQFVLHLIPGSYRLEAFR